MFSYPVNIHHKRRKEKLQKSMYGMFCLFDLTFCCLSFERETEIQREIRKGKNKETKRH